MKNFFFGAFAIAMTISAQTTQAQCVEKPPCNNSINVNGSISNQAFNGDVCFIGYGDINNSVNWNNTNVWQFNATTTPLYVYQNVNFQNGVKKLFTSGITYFYGNVSLDGSDSFVVEDNSISYLNSIISNNSNVGQRNTVVLNNTGRFFVNNIEYFAGDTIKTVPSNRSNDVYIVSCGLTSLPIKILQFEKKNSSILWKVETTEDVEILFSENGRTFVSDYITNTQEGQYSLIKSGYYRLVTGNSYSKIIQYSTKEHIGNDKVIYFHNGYFTKEKPLGVSYYGTKIIK